jgi:hypothetical protein
VKGKVGREAVSRVWGANEGCANKAIVRRSQVYVKVFCLNGPISGVHPFNTAAGSPTDMIFTGGRNCSHQTAWNYVRDNLVCLRLAEGYTRSAIEQEVIDSNTGATANGSEPIKLVFDRPINVTGNCVEASVTFEICPRGIGFKPEHK